MAVDWRPRASSEVLRARAGLLRDIRSFFRERNVLEVETPVLCSTGVTDPSIEPLVVSSGVSLEGSRFLQTSPEYAMKRLLAAGVGPVFQIARAFRGGEAGARHNPEFSLLEWYQPDFDHHRLMDEVGDLLRLCLGDRPIERLCYRDAFRKFLDIDPFSASLADLQALARRELDVHFDAGERDLWLDLLMSHLIEPQLQCSLIFDYPASQAALSRIVRVDDVEIGQRFELYVNGMELANGYNELTDPIEQRGRFLADNRRRRAAGQAEVPVDELLLAALEHGLPDCSGVALGVDRLLMLVMGAEDIRDVMSFDWDRS